MKKLVSLEAASAATLRKLVDRLAANGFVPFIIEDEKGYNLTVTHNGDYDTNGFVDISLSIEFANCSCCGEKITTKISFLVKNDLYLAYYFGCDYPTTDIYCHNVHAQSLPIVADERYVQNILTQIANYRLYIIGKVYEI